MLFNGTWTQASIDGYNPELNYAWFPSPAPDGVTKVPFSIDCSIAAMSGTGHEEEAKRIPSPSRPSRKTPSFTSTSTGGPAASRT